MGMNAGQLDRPVRFLRAEVSDDGLQTRPGEFRPHGPVVFASRRDVSDAEKLSSGAVLAELTAHFRVRSSALTRGLTTADRLTCEGQTFNILGIKQADARGTFLEITAASAGRP